MNAPERKQPSLAVDLDRANINLSTGFRHRGALFGIDSVQTATAAFAALVLVPVIYSAVLFSQWHPLALSVHELSQLSMHCLCNLIVALASFTATGRLELKIIRALTGALALHAGTAIAVAAAGSPVTLLAFLLSFSVSMGLSVAILCIFKNADKRVAAIETLSLELRRWLGTKVDIVCEATTDLRKYDLVLLDTDKPLSPVLAKSLTRAVLAGAEISHPAEYLERSRSRVSPDHFKPDHLGSGISSGTYASIKRVLDLSVLLVIAPISLLTVGAACLAVMLTLGRPIFFVQDRVGRGGRIFRMYKLRTMLPPNPTDVARATAKNDQRITPMGHFLRRYRIDELPQFWNVLRGDMSLIGPRPEQPKLAMEYGQQMPAYSWRHLVRPGITGLAQVSCGYAANFEETREKLTYDLHYIKHFGFALDMRIAAMTIVAVINGVSAR